MHIEYSKSDKNAQQNEIQSAYFGQNCLSILTACCYYRGELSDGLENIPVTIARDSSDHSRIATFSCVDMLVKNIQAKLKPKELKVFIWRDGCASQF